MALMALLSLLGCTPEPAKGADTAAEATLAEAVAPDDLIAIAGEAVSLDGSASTGDAFSWDLGDGTVLDGATVEHAWEAPGTYLVTLTADGSPPDRDTLHVKVVNPPLDPAPVASGALVSDGTRLFAVLPDFDQIAVVEDGAVSARIDTCDVPRALAWDAGQLAVACRDGVRVYDDALAEVGAVDGPAAAVLLHDGLWILRPDGTLEHPDGTEEAALSGRALVGWSGTVATAAFISPQETGAWWRAGEAFSIARDPGPDSDTNARGVPNLLGAGAMRPDGEVIVWGGLKSNTERGEFVEGTTFNHDNVVRATLEVLEPADGTEREGPLFDNRDRVGAVAWTPLGDRLLVAHHGAWVVDILDGETFQRVGGLQAVGQGLDGLWTDGDTAWVLASLDRQLIAYDLTAGNAQIEIARIDLVEDEILPAAVLLGAQVFHAAGDPRMTTDAYISCGSCHPDGGHDGRTWDFTQRGEGMRSTLPIWGIPDGGPFHWSANFDELQDFENDIRLHQDGAGYLSEDDWAAEGEPLGAPRAGLSEELDALAAYMAHLAEAAIPTPPGPETDLETFSALGCGDCHSGPRLTDAAWDGDEPVVHDVGTLTEATGQRLGGPLVGLRTPSLLGVAWTGPWLHDGSADTLDAAVRAHDGYRDLSDTQLDTLVAELRGL